MDKNFLSFRNRATVIGTALGVASALAVGGAMVAPTVAAAAPSCALSGMTSTSQGSCWHPADGGPFNTQLSASPALASNSAAVVSHMNTYNWSVGLPGGGFTLGAGSRPMFFAKPSDPTMNIVCGNAFGPNSCTGA